MGAGRKGEDQDLPNTLRLTIQSLARVNFEPQDSAHDGHGCGNP